MTTPIWLEIAIGSVADALAAHTGGVPLDGGFFAGGITVFSVEKPQPTPTPCVPSSEGGS